MMWHLRTLAFVLVSAVVSLPSTAKGASSFLPEMSFTEILTKYDVVLIARLENPNVSDSLNEKELKPSQLEVVDLLKGEESLDRVRIVTRALPVDVDGELFLMAGNRNKSGKVTRWRVARSVTEECHQHVLSVSKTKETGAQQLAFFQPFIEHADESVSANAHMEFVVATDEAFAAACDQMDRAKIREWLDEPDIMVDRQRLYFAMLAHCGNESDGEWLQEVLAAKKTPSILNVQIGCFLAVKGEAGLPLVNRLYLSNRIADRAGFTESYAAIQALRFVRDLPNSPFSRESLISSFRLVLEDERMADLVVSDLAYLEDWESLNRVVELFKQPHTFHVSFVNFVRACPLPIAKDHTQELTDFDAATVRRAQTFFPMPQKDTRIKTTLRRHYRANAKFRC